MKNQKGFIQIPILTAIVVGVLVLGGAGYFSVKKYKAVQQEKAVEQQRQQEQQTALEKARADIEKLKANSEQAKRIEQELRQGQIQVDTLKRESEVNKTKQEQLEQQVNANKRPEVLTISSDEIQPLLSAVVNIQCFLRNNIQIGDPNNPGTSGSGTFWKWNNQYAILTNDHVMSPGHTPNCDALWTYDTPQGKIRGDSFQIDRSNELDWNKKTDVRVAIIGKNEISAAGVSAADANYRLYNMRRCPAKIALGSSVVVIGYPATTNSQVYGVRTVTEGIISAYDQSVQPPIGTLPYANYFVSNKIDSGNSGGIAISKDSEGLCVLGIPTWLQVGDYENVGLIQNINNVLYSQ